MALLKKAKSIPSIASNEQQCRRSHPRDEATLIEFLNHDDPQERRYAARDLNAFPEAIDALCDCVTTESELIVSQAIFDTLSAIGGERVVERLMPMLKSEDAALRNGVIEVLQGFPQEVAPRIASLLNDPDSDVRIFAIDVLQILAHPEAPGWLLEVIRDEEHINVVGTALDRLAEIGTPEMLPDLQAVKLRFSGEAYISFSADICIQRLTGS